MRANERRERPSGLFKTRLLRLETGPISQLVTSNDGGVEYTKERNGQYEEDEIICVNVVVNVILPMKLPHVDLLQFSPVMNVPSLKEKRWNE